MQTKLLSISPHDERRLIIQSTINRYLVTIKGHNSGRYKNTRFGADNLCGQDAYDAFF